MAEIPEPSLGFIKKPVAGTQREMLIRGKIMLVKILAVHDFGTFDIEIPNGDCFRLTGYSFS